MWNTHNLSSPSLGVGGCPVLSFEKLDPQSDFEKGKELYKSKERAKLRPLGSMGSGKRIP